MPARKSRSKAMAARPTTVAAYLASLTPEKLLVDAFKTAGKRLDMGKCCLHFKELDDLELTSVAKVIAMSTPKEYIAYYRRVKGLA
jgi:hypothetical protein